MTKVLPIRMLEKIYATNNFLNISGRLNARQILAVVQSMLLSLKTLCLQKIWTPHLDITGKISVDSQSLSALQSWFILTRTSPMW